MLLFRSLSILVASLCFALLAPLTATAQNWPKWEDEPRGITLELSGKAAENVLRLVSNMPWLPDGSGDGRYLYVVYTPTCPISQRLYDDTRKLTKNVEIRWIPIDPSGSINSMFEHRTAETVRLAFKNSEAPPDIDAKKTANINAYNSAALAFLVANKILSPDGNVYFPTLIYGTSEKLFITIGPVKDIAKLISALPKTEAPSEPEAVTFGAQKPEITQLTSEKFYENKSGARAPFRMFPDSKAIDIGGLPAGQKWPLPIYGVTKNGFIAFKLTENGAYLFVEDAGFAKDLLASK